MRALLDFLAFLTFCLILSGILLADLFRISW